MDEIIKFYDNLGFLDELREMFIIDAIIFNADRHLGNFGFLVDNRTAEIIKPAPLFDHNISLLCYAMKSDFNNNNCAEYLETQGHKLVDGTYTQFATELMTPQIRKKISNLVNFKILKHQYHNLPDWHLNCLDKLINNQVNEILNKTKSLAITNYFS